MIVPIAVSIAEKGFMQADMVNSLVDWDCIRVDGDLQWLSRLRRVVIDSKAYCVTPSPNFRLAYGFFEMQESFIDINVMFL